MIVDDFVMLGKTVPEPSSDGRVFVCSAGFSPELRTLIRVYPLARRLAPARWSINRVHLQRNLKDSRAESWQLFGDRTGQSHDFINHNFDQVGMLPVGRRKEALERYVFGSIDEANRKRLSLAIIHPVAEPELFFEHNPDSPNSPALRLFDVDNNPTEGSRRFAFIPRLRFSDEAGEHRLMLRDWGCFELMRKLGDEDRYKMHDALHLSAESSLLIGNLSNQRNAWLVISVLNKIRDSEQRSLFDEVPVSASPSAG